MTTKQNLRSLLAEGKTNLVLTELRKITAKNPDIQNEVIQISAQFAENERLRRLNIIDPKSIGNELNRINSIIIIIIDMIPDELAQNRTRPKWGKIALTLGVVVTIIALTWYTLKYFINFKKDNNQIEQKEISQKQHPDKYQSPNPEQEKVVAKENTVPKATLREERIRKQTDNTENKIEVAIKKNEPPKTDVKYKTQYYNSEVKDDTGKGIPNVEVYCPNCLIKKVKTDIDGNFTLEGYFEDDAAFWQSSITFSKDKKIKTQTINWREKSPQPINF